MNQASFPNNLAVIGKLAHANNVIDKFLYSCSHSMRGPLKTIRGLVNLISQNDQANQKPEPILDLIQHTAGNLENILNQMEQFLEGAKREIKIEPVDVLGVIKQLEEKFQQELNSQSIGLVVNIDPDNEVLATDREYLKSILGQLFSNAIQFADASKQKRIIQIDGKKSNSSYELVISDNGLGIPDECIGKIFQLFFRATEKSRGAGIGLYIVKQAVDELKGLISVQSQVGSGTKFLIWLPTLN